MGKIGVIGGSALYDIEGLEVVKREKVTTPFGSPSDDAVIGKMGNKEIVFIPRHGRGHGLLPTQVNSRANIYALKVLGVDRVISVSAVGSLKEHISPLDVLLVDQFVDRTNQSRPTTFFGDGIVAHIAFADPICLELKNTILKSNSSLGVKIHDGGTYINMEGPAFSTKAESRLYKSWGMDVIGMTNMSEARLAREAGMCYSTMAMITDYDCWRLGEGIESVSVEMVMETLTNNMETAKTMLLNTIKNMPEKRSCECGEALRNAIITDKKAIPAEIFEKLKPIIDGVI
ncbi:MAG: S-methyl-5'-thioadenosine phosphorylase [Candidatus Omnitrophica bacterium]|nr:S-methyl-5'-thioadenosine phosphorylase [Candidatus Omnitrophota bacterium]